MKSYDGAVNQQLSGDVSSAEISTDGVSNVQIGCVQLYFVVIMVFTGSDWDLVANASRGWSTEARFLYSACSPKNDAMLVVLMMVVWAFTLDLNDVVAEAGDAMDASAIVKGSPKVLPRGLGGARIQSSCVGRGTTTWYSRKIRVWATGKEITRDSASANVTSAASLFWICIPETRSHSKQTR